MSYTIHKCEENGCSGEMYKGLYFECYRCDTKSFIDCIENQMRYFLVYVLDIKAFKFCPEYDENTYLKRNKTKIRSIFYPDSVIHFVCTKCKNETTNSNEDLESKINKLEERLNDIRNEYSDSCQPDVNKITDMETKIDSLLTSFEKANESLQSLLERMENDSKTLLLSSKKFYSDMKNMTMGTSSDEKVCFSPYRDSFKTPIPKEMKFNTTNTFADTSNQLINKTSTNSEETLLTERHRCERSKFDPSDGLYEIYIGQFEMNMNIERIKQLILQSTNIENFESFHVLKLGGSRSCHTFASFKITTMNYDIAMKILTMNWNPQRARIFSSIPPKRRGYYGLYSSKYNNLQHSYDPNYNDWRAFSHQRMSYYRPQNSFNRIYMKEFVPLKV